MIMALRKLVLLPLQHWQCTRTNHGGNGAVQANLLKGSFLRCPGPETSTWRISFPITLLPRAQPQTGHGGVSPNSSHHAFCELVILPTPWRCSMASVPFLSGPRSHRHNGAVRRSRPEHKDECKYHSNNDRDFQQGHEISPVTKPPSSDDARHHICLEAGPNSFEPHHGANHG